MKVNALVCFGNAYDCEPALREFDRLPCDKLQLDYIKYPFNYFEAQKFFSEHKEYTHFVYVAPDIVVTAEQFIILKKRVEENDYDVYGPVCNVDKGKYSKHLACCLKLPNIPYDLRRYRWIAESQRQYFLTHGVNVLEVKFNALAFAFIKRRILEKYKFTTLPFETDEKPIWEKRGGYSCDLAFAYYCDFSKIKLLVDLRILTDHLRFYSPILVGKKPPKITFIRYQENKEYGIPSITKSEVPQSCEIL